MISTLPSYTALRASGRAVRGLPPIAVAVRLSPRADATAPATLIGRCVAVTAVPHPVLDALLKEAGAILEHGTYTLTLPANQAPTAAAATALAAVHPAAWRSGATRGAKARESVADILGPAAMTTLAAAGATPTATRPKRLAGMVVRISRTGRKLRLTPDVDGLRIGEHDLGLGAARCLLLTPHQTLDLVAAARAAGVVVVDADKTRRLADLEWLIDRSCVILPLPGAPAWAQLVCGPLVSSPASSPLPVTDAVALTRRMRGDVVAAVHPDVAAVAAAAAELASRTVVREPLHDWQDRFVSAYLVCGAGMVNALPPGFGKTVCAAAAMAERATGKPESYRSLILVPAALRGQWVDELARFFPAARVDVVEKGADLPGALQAWRTRTSPTVLLMTPQMLTRSIGEVEAAAKDLVPADLVVDEGTFLHRHGTDQHEAAWRIRRLARHAMVLTGTPDGRTVGDVGALVAFARGRRDLFVDAPLTEPHPDGIVDRVGPLVFTGPSAGVKVVPPAEPQPVPLTPGAAEQVIEDLARTRVAALLEKAAADGFRKGAPQLRTELEAWRLGLACPAALLASRYGLAADARAHGVAASLGVKGEWTLGRAVKAVKAGKQALVFSDFPAALTAVAARLDADGIAHGVLTSAVTARKRQDAIDAFTAGNLKVLLISATGQLGLNLQTAGVVVHLDVPTSAATLLQRTARAARLGATHQQIEVDVPVLSGAADERTLAHLGSELPVVDLWELARELSRPGNAVAA